MPILSNSGAAPLAGAALSLGRTGALLALLVPAVAAQAQFQRIVPPPPCVVPSGVQVRGLTRQAGGDRRPFVIVEPLDVSTTERRSLHLPWALTNRLRERLRASPRLAVATAGTLERTSYQSGGNSDSTAALLRADWVVRGSAHSAVGATEITLVLLPRSGNGQKGAAWTATFRVPSQSLAAVEDSAAKAILTRVLGAAAAVPTAAPGRPGEASTDRDLTLALYTLRDPSAAAADSARLLLERAFAADTSSPLLAVTLARAYLAVLERGGVSPSMARGPALRRAEELLKFALARDPKRADVWTARAEAARIADTLAFAGALEAHARALALAPRSADAIHELAMTYVALGEDTRAASELRRALAVEPERGSSLAALADIELRARRFREACAYSNAAVAASPFDATAYSVRARARLRLGQARDAYADAETAGRLSGEAWTQGLRLITEVGAGNRDGAAALGRTLARRYLVGTQTLSVEDARMLAAGWAHQGDGRRAIDALERARPRGRLLATALHDPVFDPLRKDAGFKALVAANAPRQGGQH